MEKIINHVGLTESASLKSRDTPAGKPINYVIADKSVVTKIMNNSTGLQRIELNGFAKRHWKTGYYPFLYGWCLGLCWGLGLYLVFTGLGY